jgi:anti-sigma factor RsiW
MNPDKLFDYLDGRLPAAERAALEERLMSDKQLQRELAVAREIHAGMHGDSREVLLPGRTDVTEQGRKMALRVGAAFIVLMAVNVGIGLWLIARHETKNPNRALLERQMRDQIANSLEHAAATFTPAPLGVSEITVPAATGKLDVLADEVVTIATRFGGSATKGLPDQGRLSVLVDVPSNREPEFRAAISSMVGQALPGSATSATASQTSGSSAFVKATADKPTPAEATQEPGATIPAKEEKKSFVIQIVEQSVKSD